MGWGRKHEIMSVILIFIVAPGLVMLLGWCSNR